MKDNRENEKWKKITVIGNFVVLFYDNRFLFFCGPFKWYINYPVYRGSGRCPSYGYAIKKHNNEHCKQQIMTKTNTHKSFNPLSILQLLKTFLECILKWIAVLFIFWIGFVFVWSWFFENSFLLQDLWILMTIYCIIYLYTELVIIRCQRFENCHVISQILVFLLFLFRHHYTEESMSALSESNIRKYSSLHSLHIEQRSDCFYGSSWS